MPRYFLKVVTLVEGSGRFIVPVEDHGDENEDSAGVGIVAKGMGQEEAAKPLALTRSLGAEPREDRHGPLPSRQPADGLGGNVREVDLAGGWHSNITSRIRAGSTAARRNPPATRRPPP
jgi:hypothetical protein